jgi:hypothetical protein
LIVELPADSGFRVRKVAKNSRFSALATVAQDVPGPPSDDLKLMLRCLAIRTPGALEEEIDDDEPD